MNRRPFLVPVALALAATLSACVSTGLGPATVPLQDVGWRLIELADQPVAPTPPELREREPHLVLHALGARVVGNAGCNRFSGVYELAGERGLSVGGVATTKRACLDQGGETEVLFLRSLGGVQAYTQEGTQLVLRDRAGRALMRFEAMPPYPAR